MAYIRGDYYIWADGENRLHLWAFDGADAWAESGWASDIGGQRLSTHQNASGVSLPQEVVDDYVVMRFAELVESHAAAEVVNRALRHRNFGGEAMKERVVAMKKAIKDMEHYSE
jgi:hypothetical protein